MHAITHSLAHRAPPATTSRTRVRWQPYNNSSNSISIQSPPQPNVYLLTPTSSVSSNSPATPPCEKPRIRQAPPPSSYHPIANDSQVRDTSKHKYALGLVDQAVKSLTEIWPANQIPCVFLTPTRVASHGEVASAASQMKPAPLRRHNTQLPSPASPSTRPSPATPAAPLLTVSGPTFHSGVSDDCQSSLVPIKGFVHEVLRRSRTSGGILQTALCYLEAIRHQIPELANLETLGLGVKGEPELGSRVTCGVDINDAELTSTASPEGPATVRISDMSVPSMPPSSVESANFVPKATSAGLPALPPLPSPLLCPRRAFLASLILASKFTQDKCYSNRAWAKLSGLPAREIGRCERALGEALDWRLWVGKLPDPPMPASNRTMVRSKSDGNMLATPPNNFNNAAAMLDTPDSFKPAPRGLRRCSTLPAESYQPPQVVSNWPDPYIPTTSEPLSQARFTSTMPTSVFSREDSPDSVTPSLSYSPSSSASSSSSGDRTIQTGFIDESLQPFGPGSSLPYSESVGEMDLEVPDATQTWPWHIISKDSAENFYGVVGLPTAAFDNQGMTSIDTNIWATGHL